MILVPVVSCFECESTLLKAGCIKIKRFVVYLGVHLVDCFHRFRAASEGTCAWDGVTGPLLVNSEVVGYSCVAVIFQPLSFELFLCHVFVRLDWRAKTKGVVDVESEVVVFCHLFGAFDADCDLIIYPGFRLGGGFGLLRLGRRRSACLRVDYVVSSWACFRSGVVSWLVAEDTFEYAITFAWDAMSAWAFVVVILHRVVTIAPGASYFAFWDGTFPSEMVHRVTA